MNRPDSPAAGRPEFHPPAESAAPRPPAGPAAVPAEPGPRFLARVFDTVLTFLCTLAGGLAVTGVFLAIHRGNLDDAGPEYGVPMVIVILGTPFLYEWLQVRRWGGTAGKLILGLRVVRASDGGPVPPGRAALRALCYSPGVYYVPNWLPVLAQLNVLWMFWDGPRRRCLHDKLAKTVVVKTAPALPHPA